MIWYSSRQNIIPINLYARYILRAQNNTRYTFAAVYCHSSATSAVFSSIPNPYVTVPHVILDVILADKHDIDYRCHVPQGVFLATSTDLLLFPDRKPGKWKGLGICLPSKMKLSKCCKSVSEIRLRNIMHCRRPRHHLFCLIGMMNYTSQLLLYIFKFITWNKLLYPCHNIVDG